MEKQSLKYKYIIISYGYDYYDYVYRQFEDSTYAKYIHNITFPYLLEKIFYRCRSLSCTKPLLRNLWAKLFLHYINCNVKSMISSEDKICFVFLAGGLNIKLIEYGLKEEVKRKFPNSKIVYYISDVSETTRSYIPSMKNNSDLVITFDPGDAKKYNLYYHVIPYSKIDYLSVPIKYDLTFVGIAKERLNSLISICNYLKTRDVKCRFVIVNAPKSQQIDCEGIEFRDRVSYEENINILLSSKCVLDYTKNTSCVGNTLRIGEAIVLNKKLLTNNHYIKTNGIYEERYMKIFSSCEDIDVNFIKENVVAKYKIQDKLYPKNLLCFIERNLVNE